MAGCLASLLVLLIEVTGTFVAIGLVFCSVPKNVSYASLAGDARQASSIDVLDDMIFETKVNN